MMILLPICLGVIIAGNEFVRERAPCEPNFEVCMPVLCEPNLESYMPVLFEGNKPIFDLVCGIITGRIA